jgi:septin family protein
MFCLPACDVDARAVENENHCDFRKLRSLLIRTSMLDLISTTEESHYENYCQRQMETRKYGERKVKKFNNPKFQEEEEQLRRRFTEQVIWTHGSITRPLKYGYGVYPYPARVRCRRARPVLYLCGTLCV